MMFVLYASERKWLALSRPEIPLAEHVIGTVAWSAFLALAPAATCCLVLVPSPAPALLLDDLRTFRRTHPFAPLVLVGDRTILHDIISFAEFVRPPLEVQRLGSAIQRACARSLLAEAAARVSAALDRPPAARAAFALACRAELPVRSVNALASFVGCHRRTLWRQWRARAPEGARTIEGLLDWTLLLRACTLAAGPGSFDAVAERIGVHRHTLARTAARCAGVSLREFTPDVAAALRAAFRERVLDPFIGEVNS